MRTILRLLGDHRAAGIAVVALYLSVRLVGRIQRHGGDERIVTVVLAIDAGLVAWAVWDEVTRRRRPPGRER